MIKPKPLFINIVLLFLMSSFVHAQEGTEAPLDTLTRRVAMQQQAIDLMNRVKITGYVQTQFQVADSLGQASYNGGTFTNTDKRFQLRRGRIKVTYDSPLNEKGISPSQFVFQIDESQAGVRVVDVFGKLTDPWIGWFSITAGLQNRPFGYEIIYSSNMRESPERGRLSQIIFPNERDLGAMLTIQGPKTGRWNWLKFEGGFFNGTGGPAGPTAVTNSSDYDKKKDFIGHIVINRAILSERVKLGFGASYYNGGNRIDTVNTYKLGKDAAGVTAYIIDSKKADVSPFISNRNYTKREIMGVDFQCSIDWKIGITTIRGEYIQGLQPGTANSTSSPASINTADIYFRNFNGAYFYFVQNIMQTPFQLVTKYDWYDPNTKVKGDEIGSSKDPKVKNTGVADMKYSTLGWGLAYRLNEAVKLTAYVDMVENETSKNVKGYENDLRDNQFTLRMQVKF